MEGEVPPFDAGSVTNASVVTVAVEESTAVMCFHPMARLAAAEPWLGGRDNYLTALFSTRVFHLGLDNENRLRYAVGVVPNTRRK